MKPVTQTREYRSDASRGNCMAACVASIFELPLSAVPRKGHGDLTMTKWLRRRYPGIGTRRVTYFKPHPKYPYEYVDEFLDEPRNAVPGFWIATVKSPRFTTMCGRCAGEGRITVILENKSKRGIRCFHCEGTGRVSGLHAVVMEWQTMVWDPSPKRDMGIGGFHGETSFVILDPSKFKRER